MGRGGEKGLLKVTGTVPGTYVSRSGTKKWEFSFFVFITSAALS